MDSADVNRIERMMIDFKDEIKEEFRHQLGIQSEGFQCKLDLVVEGHQMLSDKLDRVEERLDGRIDCVVNKLDTVAAQGNTTAAKLDNVVRKLDAIAADLSAHRADTEAHPPVYRVKE
jgi:hypothetical protein